MMRIDFGDIAFNVDETERENYWVKVIDSTWEPHTYKIFRKYLNPKHSFIDVGAWIGSTALFGCQLAKHCYAIEPDIKALKELKRNIELNPSLKNDMTVWAGCILDRKGTAEIGIGYHGTTLGDSNSSVHHKGELVQECECLTFEQFIEAFNITDCNFVKIDVEGAETKMIPSMKYFISKYKPTILVSLHCFLYQQLKLSIEEMIEVLGTYKKCLVVNITGDFKHEKKFLDPIYLHSPIWKDMMLFADTCDLVFTDE